jgi:hypothetical protein
LKPQTILRSAVRNGLSLWRSGQKLQWNAPEGFMTSNRLAVLREHKEALLPLLPSSEDPYVFDAVVYAVLKGEAEPSTILHLLNHPRVDDDLRRWVQRAIDGYRLEHERLIRPFWALIGAAQHDALPTDRTFPIGDKPYELNAYVRRLSGLIVFGHAQEPALSIYLENLRRISEWWDTD